MSLRSCGLRLLNPGYGCWGAKRVFQNFRLYFHRYWVLAIWLAVAFMLERSLERYLPPAWIDRINEYLTPEKRRSLFIGIAIIAFLYANFRAFDGERDAKE